MRPSQPQLSSGTLSHYKRLDSCVIPHSLSHRVCVHVCVKRAVLQPRVKPRSHCVRRRTSTQHTADANYYATYRRCQWALRNMLHFATVYVRRCSVCVCVNAAVEMNVLDYNVAVRRTLQCERGFGRIVRDTYKMAKINFINSRSCI